MVVSFLNVFHHEFDFRFPPSNFVEHQIAGAQILKSREIIVNSNVLC